MYEYIYVFVHIYIYIYLYIHIYIYIFIYILERQQKTSILTRTTFPPIPLLIPNSQRLGDDGNNGGVGTTTPDDADEVAHFAETEVIPP